MYNIYKYFYHKQLSDVQMGGYASFPELGFGFKPSRGSALVVHNMDNAANCDIRSLQATCPVLLGTHWGKYIIDFPLFLTE